MLIKKYEIKEFNITFDYPSSWTDTIEENNTFLLYDEMLGSFRLTPIKISDPEFKIDSYLRKRYEDNRALAPKWLTFGNLKFVCYTEIANNEDNVVIHYFITGKGNVLLITSFAYDAAQEGSNEIKEEIEKVKKALSSINIGN